LAKLIDSQNV